MLALSRNVGESIIITTSAGEVIEVQLVRISGDARRQAQIGIEAPKSVHIRRAEISPIIPANRILKREAK